MNEVKLAAAQGSTPFRWRGMIWIVCKARKPSRCWHTGALISTGAYQFRPLSNGQHRMERLSEMPANAEPFPGAANLTA